MTDPGDEQTPLGQTPDIELDKFGTLNDDDGTPGVSEGDTISYTFRVENDGNVTLSNITLADTVGGVTISGGPITSLAPGAVDTTTFTGSYTITQADIDAGTFDNVALVTGTDPGGNTVTDPGDEQTPLGQTPDIELDKFGTLNDDDGTPGVSEGDTISYTFRVENDGNVTLSNVTLADTVGGVTISGGPITSLAPGAVDTTTFTGSYTITQADIDAGTFDNVALVTGTDPGGNTVTDPGDEQTPLGQTPDIDLEKATNGFDADSPTGPLIVLGDEVTWTYEVTNTGNVTLTDVMVHDDVLGNIGTIASLAPGASEILSAERTAIAGQYENLGTAIGTDPSGGTVEDSDPSHYFGVDFGPNNGPDIQKYTNSPNAEGNAGDFVAPYGYDADSPTGPVIPVGDTVTWTYVVTNETNVAFDPTEDSSISVTDSVVGVDPILISESITTNGILEVDEVWVYEATGTATEGQYENTGTVDWTYGPLDVSDSNEDPSHYFGCPPCEFDIFKSFSGPNINVTILLEEYVNGQGEDAGVKFTVTESDNRRIGDIRGVFFHVEPDDTDVLTGLKVVGADVTEFRVGEDAINDLGDGANMKGDGGYRYEDGDGDIIKGHKYDVGVEIGTQGKATDDIQSTMFIVSNPDFELNLENFADVEFGVRLTSVGFEGGSRNQSSKVFGESPEDCGCIPGVSPIPELIGV